ncbi:T9SS type A sorting domain-containing protein [Maribellus sp. YY47]|uniref:T9SS type A sorting domain-containing protein n=1 Tax=Maribellus sp. YY47 TaxID=2929486 RepID=UPI0020013481|nr:T9SS type A sorting domain-containing protein [Maribellus sp. YY47]MCK3685976.1 T9SS type A sorting domain-containing protein [Maribellus sp. YY47]
MKTRFTCIFFMLVMFGIGVNAKQKSLEGRKLPRLNIKSIALNNGTKVNELRHLTLTGDQFSEPGFSQDFSWDEESGGWMYVTNTTYSYNDVGAPTGEVIQDAGTDLYLFRNSYDYDYFGNITEDIAYTRGVDEWIISAGEKSVYTVNGNGDITGVTHQTWENFEWVNKTKDVYTLNAQNVPTEMETYTWNGTGWDAYSKTMDITWTNWNKRELGAYTLQLWKEGAWENAERFSSSRNGNTFTDVIQLWKNNEWVNEKRETYTSTDTEEQITLELWRQEEWQKKEKYLASIDGRGNQTGVVYSSWDGTEWYAEMELFFDLTYNESDDVTQMVFRYRDPSMEEPANISKFLYSSFLHFTTDVPVVELLDNVQVFPNPVNNSLNIHIDDSQLSTYEVNILSLTGQKVFSGIFSTPTISVNTGYFTAGTYVLNILNKDGRVYNTELMKQ